MGALEGIRVLDLSRVLAGPWCGQNLADLGAEVIKVERPQLGDDTRLWGPPWMKDNYGNLTQESAYYQTANRNKYSIAVDIATPEGQAIIHDLVKISDVLIENYKSGSLKKYNLDYDSLKQINPKLVYCSITGFGQTGPRAAEPGYDFIIQGMGGLMSITGEEDSLPGGGPQKVGVAVTDLMTGLYATIAIQAAIMSRYKTGIGQYIDIALLDVQIAMLANQGMNYLTSGCVPLRYGNAHPNIVPYQVFKSYDQDFILACGNDSQFSALCQVIGLPELAQDIRYATNASRVKHRDTLIDFMSDYFLTRSAKEWVTLIQSVKVPVGLINNIAQAISEPQVQNRNMIIKLPHPLNENLTLIGSPMNLSETPVTYHKPPPTLGEDTESILSKVRDQQTLENLREQGIIQ